MNQGEIVIYQTQDGKTELNVSVGNDTVWLTQAQIATLFGTQRPAITKHLKNIFKEGELDEASTCSILEHIGENPLRGRYQTVLYNLDVILSVG
ncbi:MAG: cytochrome C biogenesis protein CycH, partial [Prevotellaceae bacterium]|nr:cytochrome C biogenesis protein CycH [Prevotellaceae bacterium]